MINCLVRDVHVLKSSLMRCINQKNTVLCLIFRFEYVGSDFHKIPHKMSQISRNAVDYHPIETVRPNG